MLSLPSEAKRKSRPIVSGGVAVSYSTFLFFNPIVMSKPTSLSAPAPAWWRRVYSASGRARRLEYGIYLLVFLLLLYVCWKVWEPYLLSSPAATEMGGERLAVSVLTFAVGFLPYLFATIRRLHDFNQKGVWALCCFVPVFGQIVAIVLTVIEGSHGDNRYGANPKREIFLAEMRKYESLNADADDELPNPQERF